jgi:hypothetical protein
MGRRYGGRFSPPGAGEPNQAAPPAAPFANRRAKRTSLRARLLYLFPVPLFFAGLGATMRGSPIEAAVELAGFAGLMLGAWLTNEGIKAAGAFEARTVAKPPAVPRKLLGAALIGASVFGVGLISLGQGLLGALVFGAMAAAAHVVAFGPDPLKAKGIVGDDLTTERVARAIDEAEAVVRDTMTAARSIGDRRLEGRIERLADQAREVFRAIERDPRDLSRARRFLSVYLVGLRDATAKFADFYGRTRDAEARAKYEALLADLETSFGAKRAALLEDRSGDLEIEIEVLRERLQQDGLIAR